MSGFRHFADEAALAEAAAEAMSELASASVAQRGHFRLALPGGRTPQLLYALLARPERSRRFPWSHTEVFWSDERCVPLGSPESNAGAAWRLLVSRVPIPISAVHPAPVDAAAAPERVAELWEEQLRRLLVADPRFPSLDLAVLGIGADGHTASLFAGDPALAERERWVRAVPCPGARPLVPRVTLTLPVLENTRAVLFLAGAEKRAVTSVLEANPERARLLFPAARVGARESLRYYLADR